MYMSAECLLELQVKVERYEIFHLWRKLHGVEWADVEQVLIRVGRSKPCHIGLAAFVL